MHIALRELGLTFLLGIPGYDVETEEIPFERSGMSQVEEDFDHNNCKLAGLVYRVDTMLTAVVILTPPLPQKENRPIMSQNNTGTMAVGGTVDKRVPVRGSSLATSAGSSGAGPLAVSGNGNITAAAA